MMWTKLVALLAVAAVGVGAGWWLWLGPGAAPPVGGCAATDRFERPEAAVAFEPTIHWELATLPPEATDPDEQIMLAAISVDHGWVASGRSSTGPTWHGFMLRSADGATWTTDPGDAATFADAEVGLMAEIDGRVVAGGSVLTDTVRPGLWVNRGAGSWQAARGPFDPSWPSALAAGERSLLLLGAADSGGAPVAWTSAEGSVWERTAVQLPVDPAFAGFGALQRDGDGWLAVGSMSRGADAPMRPVIWASADGLVWTCSLLDTAGFDRAQPDALHRSAQGWLATGTAGDSCGMGGSCIGYSIAWTSPDGVRWSAGITDTEPWHAGGIAVAGSAEGFVAVGHGTTWWSADGTAWVELDDGGTGARALIGQPDALAMTDDGRILAAGTTYEGADADAWIATGVLER